MDDGVVTTGDEDSLHVRMGLWPIAVTEDGAVLILGKIGAGTWGTDSTASKDIRLKQLSNIAIDSRSFELAEGRVVVTGTGTC